MRQFLLLFLFISVPTIGSMAECFDHSIWNKILEANVDQDGFVDYNGVRVNKGGTLYEYLTYLELAELGLCTKAEKKAFWINAYNANVFRLVLKDSNISDLPYNSPFYNRKIEVANERLTLNKVRDQYIRKSDPRMIFAISPGTIGGPNLLPKAISGKTIEEQLNWAVVQFVNTPSKISIKDGRLQMSDTIKQFEMDFDQTGGVGPFLKKYVRPKMREDAGKLKQLLGNVFAEGYDLITNSKLNSKTNKP